ncbi:preprotein translocase subunit Sec61beta [Candidatus Woesearchaeota archaeon]|nr:MAG: preprotein translocase subunit Sec61beta [Candidatus Woesearchaeota archaeon]
MAKNNRISMPQSGGGLVRYFDEFKSKFEIDPKVVIGLIVAVIVIMFFLHKFKPLG